MGCRGQPTCYRCKDCRGPNFKRPVEVTTIRTKRGADKKQGKLRAFKVLRKESYYSSGRTRRSWRGPYYDYRYIVGKIAKELYPDRSTCRACGVGINVSTLSDCLKWILQHQGSLYEWKIGVLEFTRLDIAAIPTVSGFSVHGNMKNKFRLFRAKLVKVLSPKEAKKIYG